LPTASLAYESTLEIYSIEGQQIWQRENGSLVIGARYQTGTFDTSTALGASTRHNWRAPLEPLSSVSPPRPSPRVCGLIWNGSPATGYFNFRVFDPLLLSAGVAYDYLEFP